MGAEQAPDGECEEADLQNQAEGSWDWNRRGARTAGISWDRENTPNRRRREWRDGGECKPGPSAAMREPPEGHRADRSQLQEKPQRKVGGMRAHSWPSNE